MENWMKQRLSRMFRASFGSCRTRSIPDVIEKAVFAPQDQTHFFRVFEPPSTPSPKPQPSPSICKLPQTRPRQKVSDRYYSPFGFADKCGSTCPLVSPISPLMYYKKERKKSKDQRSESKHKSKKNKKSRVKSTNREARLCSSSLLQDNSAYYSWLSSDDEDDDDMHTLFSSRSTTLSSDSSGSLRRKKRSSRRSGRRERVGSRNSEIGGSNALPLMEGKVKDSFAVVKKSSDPYNDFRTSMVEMIVEKQIFGAKDLEKLLQLFLSLNPDCHHRVIVEVFTEIWEALFSDWS